MARALLDISTKTLAEQVGIALNSLNKIERGESRAPHKATMARLVAVLTAAGAEFLPDDGVRRRQDGFQQLLGADSWLRLLDDVFHVLQATEQPEALFICIDDRVSSEAVRLSNFRLREAGVRCRYLCSDSATRFDYPRRDYRCIPAHLFVNSPILIYADKVATLRGSGQAVVIMRDADHAAALRGLFELIWAQSPMPHGEKA